MNQPLFIDTEVTGATNDSFGHPFDSRNRLCYIGCLLRGNSVLLPIEISNTPYGQNLESCRKLVSQEATLCVGFNIKFDLHWLCRYGIPYPKLIWDCQYAQYCIWRQSRPFPSLDSCLEYYGFPKKLDRVEKEYWEKGIDTDQVPPDILEEYLAGDLIRTQWVYESQMNYLADKPELLKLILLGNHDILVTAEMEWNGFKYQNEKSLQKGKELEARILEIDRTLDSFVSGASTDWNSSDFLSAFLYGGVVKETFRESYTRTLKSGEVKEKERWSTREIQLPALAKPPKGSARTSKDGFFGTSKDVLLEVKDKSNKKVKKIIDLLLERSEIEKLASTYYFGFPKIYESKYWSDDLYHPQITHVITRTGRLSSQKPNGQNIPDPIRELMVSRYG